MNRKLMLYQIKERQISFLLEDIQKSIEEYKKIIETKGSGGNKKVSTKN